MPLMAWGERRRDIANAPIAIRTAPMTMSRVPGALLGGAAGGSMVAVMRRMRATLAVVAVLLAVSPVAACGGGVLSPDLVLVNGGEPPNPLIPTGTNDSYGGRIIDRLFAGLVSYDAKGKPSLEVAQSIDTTDNVNYRILLKPGWGFTDGSPVTAHSFVDAWNYGALSTNAQLQQHFFSRSRDTRRWPVSRGKESRPRCRDCMWSTTGSSPCGCARRPSISC